MPRVLVIDDEPDLVRVLEYNLRQSGYEVDTATSGETGLVIAKGRKPDVIVLDLMLPDISGFEVCRQIRGNAELKSVPVLLLTAKSGEEDRIAGLERGADDYVTKPFSQRELVLRVGALLRRGPSRESPASLAIGPLKLEVDSHRLYIDGEEVELTFLEFDLLRTLMERPNRAQTRDRLLAEVWGDRRERDPDSRTVDTHVKRLRDKLGKARDLVETVRGVGYRLTVPADMDRSAKESASS